MLMILVGLRCSEWFLAALSNQPVKKRVWIRFRKTAFVRQRTQFGKSP